MSLNSDYFNDHISGQRNPIIRLANQMVEQSSNFDRIEVYAQRLVDDVEARKLEEASQLAAAGYRSVRHSDLIFRLVAYVFGQRGFPDAAEECHYLGGDVLSDILDAEAMEAAAWHFEACSEYCGPSFLSAQLNLASVRYMLAGLRSDSLENLSLACDIIESLRSQVDPSSDEYYFLRQVEASVAIEYAFNGVDLEANVAYGLEICDEIVQECNSTKTTAQAYFVKGKGLKLFAVTASDPAACLLEGIGACEGGRSITDVAENPAHYARLLGLEAAIRISLAQLGNEPIQHIQCALEIARQAEALPKITSHDVIAFWAAQAVALRLLVKWRSAEASIEDLHEAMALAQRVEEVATPENLERGPMLLCGANCLLELADRGIEAETNLSKALAMIESLLDVQAKTPGLAVAAAVTGATIRKKLAERGTRPGENLRKAIEDCIHAGNTGEGSGRYRDLLYIVRAAAHSALADLGIEQEKNLRAAVFLCSECQPLTQNTDPIALKAHLDTAFAMRKLSTLGVDSDHNLQSAIERCSMVARATESGAASNPLHRELLNAAIDGMASCLTTMSALQHESDLPKALEHLERSISYATHLCTELPHDSAQYRDTLLNEAILRLSLGVIREESDQLRQSLSLCDEAALLFSPESRQWAACQAIAADCEYKLSAKEECIRRLDVAVRTHLTVRLEFSREDDRIAYESRVHHLFELAVVCV